MAYSSNILPKASAYYELNRASIVGSELHIDAGGYAEIEISSQMLPALTSKMLLTAHPSVFSSGYANDGPQITLSIVTSVGERIEHLVPISESASGVFNTEVLLPAETFMVFTYRISSAVDVVLYNWELCSEEDSDITTVIEGVEQTIPKLLYDYNTFSYAVAQSEITVGLISCFLQSATDLQGHFSISFFATERCNVHVRIKDNNVTELFSPQVYTVEKGYASISVPHAYLKKMATAHAFSVTLQCTNGQLSIPVRGMLYTIDGGYLATRLLDAGIDVQDIAVKQLSSDAEPSQFYAIGFEGSRILLKSRDYNQLHRVNWTALKDFGEGIAAAIEFNGSWTLRQGAEKFTLETDDNPFVFIVDTNGTLKVYSGEDFENVEVLDTNVSGISACKGYNSMYFLESDQGVVAAYLLNGNVYYRQYAYKADVGGYTWLGRETLYDGGDASFVSIHRLPDYRIGMCVSHTIGTKWYITDRTYVAQGFKPEIIISYVDSACIVTIRDLSDADTDYSTAVKNEFDEDQVYHNGFVLTFPTKLAFLKNKNVNDLKRMMTVYINDKKVEAAIADVKLTDNVITVTLHEAVRGSSTVRIDLNCYYLVTIAPNGCFVATTQSYTWSLPLPTIRTSSTEEIGIGIDATFDATVREIITSTKTPKAEELSVSVSGTFECEAKQVSRPTLNFDKESVGVSVSGTFEAVISQVGTTPV